MEKSLDIYTAGDLLRHYPRRYFERGELTDLATLVVGQHANLQVKVVEISAHQMRPKLHKTDLTLTDGTGTLLVTFFNRRFLTKTLSEGAEIVIAGEVD